MRYFRILLFVSALVALSAATVSLSLGRPRANKSAKDATSGHDADRELQQQLQDIDQKWLHAATVQDTDFLKQLFAPGMFEIQRGGVVETGEEMRQAIGRPGRHIQIDIDNVVVRGVYGNTAIITDRTTQQGTAPDGRKIGGEYTVTRVLRREGGQWRAIGAQMTPTKSSTSATPITSETGWKPTTPEEKEIVAIDHKWVDAATAGDVGYLKTLFGDRMFEVEPDGHVMNGEEMLKGMSTRKPGQFQGFCDQIVIRGIYGDTAVLTDRRVLKGKNAEGKEINGQWRMIRILVKQGGHWRAVGAAMTAIE